ncbi:MAG: hypothetical protein EZS28_030987 [Streblomastix strix]|uniref:Uncharacterized protein n=1 Tax=Streblomastix strix TaxID=222440 RepID=A0A5J4US35_9EUKA|nr:MAG: hypothetical protein EZS28_030987 [Streblomastix strix]
MICISVVDQCFLIGLIEIQDEDLIGTVQNHVFSKSKATTERLARLLLVLSVLSFAKESRNKLFAKFDRIKATAPTRQNDILYFEIGSIDKDGVLQADYSKLDPLKDLGYDEFKFSKGKPYQSGTKITDPSFYAVPQEGFSELLTSRALNQSEYTCQLIYDTHIQGFYGLLGYTIKAIRNVDIAPSITYVLKNYPKSVHYKYPGNVEEAALVEPQTCNSYDCEQVQSPCKELYYVLAEQKAQINITGQQNPIGKIIISFSSCNILRNGGNTSINYYSLAVVNHGSLILEKLNISGQNKERNEALIQAASPRLIQFTSLTVSNIALSSGNTNPLLLSVTYDQTNQIKNDDHSELTILLIENSEIVKNTLASISEACTIQLEGLEPDQILIINSTFNSRSPPNNNTNYEFKIFIPSGSDIQFLIDQLKVINFGIASLPVAAKVFPDTQFNALAIPLSDEYENITVNNNGQEQCISYIANYHNDDQSVGCAMIIMREQDNVVLFKGVPRSISITGSFTENDLRTDSLAISFFGTNDIFPLNKTSFKRSLPISTNPADSSLFRIHDGGQVRITYLFIQRSNQIGSENAPIAMIISRTGQQSNRLQKNETKKPAIKKYILEGGNSAFSDVWYDLGFVETCNVGYGAAIDDDGQTIVQISGSTIRTLEGPAVRALNGASVTSIGQCNKFHINRKWMDLSIT